MDSSNDNHPVFHGTTILSVRRQTPQGLQVAIGGDGQVTLGNIIVKGTARLALAWPTMWRSSSETISWGVMDDMGKIPVKYGSSAYAISANSY